MNWIKIIAFLLPAIISIGTFYSTKQEKPKWVRNLCVLIVISTIVGIVLERRDNHSKNKEQNDLKQQNKLQIEEIRSLKDRMIAFQTLNTLMPGNEPDPPTTFRDKPPADAIKLYLGSCLAWWKSKGTHTRSLVTINNEPVLTLGLEENGLFLSGKIRRPEDGREVMNLINNKFVRNPNVFVDPQQPSEHEIIVSGKSGERLLYVNYLNEKAIAIEGTFYDSQGNWILTIDDREIVDMFDNRFLPGASFGGNENLFTYQTLLERYQLTVRVLEPVPIDISTSQDRLEFMYKGTPVKNLSRAIILVSNTGREPIRLGFDGTIELAITGQFLDLEKPPLIEKSDNIFWDPVRSRLILDRLLIKPKEIKAIHLLMQGEWKCDVYTTLRDGKVIKFNMDADHFIIH